jgi:hypothetical protein
MAKKQSDGEVAEAAGKRRPQKKTAPAKPGARSRPAKGGKPSQPARPSKPSQPARPSKPSQSSRSAKTGRIPRPTRPPPVPPAQAELPIGDADLEVIEDADIVFETRVDAVAEAAAEGRPSRGEPDDDEGLDDVLEEVLADDEDDEDGEQAAAAEPADDALEEVVEVEDQPPALSPEEQELATVYGDELSRPAIAHAEYTDRQTADEDRPMVPEINARDERKLQWQERRDRRRRRRDERDRQRAERRDQPHGAPRPAHDTRPDRPDQGAAARGAAEPRQPHPSGRPPVPSPGASSPAIQLPAGNGEHDALARVGTPLGDAAATVFAQLRNGQPLPVRQLAAMMRKRSLVETDPEQLWPQLKAELLGDERSYRALGLRPRIVYRGRDLFAPGPVAMSQTADAEASVAAALSRLAGATHRALAARIAKASGQGFERLIHAYLVAAGYRDIAWIKRVGGIAYAQAIAPGLDRMVLISARSGDQPIDRRGIGELRVGVEAKDLVAGILFSARELSEDAEHELERAGRSISVICGDQLVAALISTGVGVVSAAAPLHYVDDQLLDELLAG